MATIEQVRKGLEVFERYKGPRSYCLDAQHDIIYGPEGGENVQTDEDGAFVSCSPPWDEDMKLLTAVDARKLKRWGWFIDVETGRWAIHP